MAMGNMEERFPLFPLRALLEFDTNYQVFVGRCLETGSVVTGDNLETVQEMLKELLEDEIEFAIKHQNHSNLYSNPAPQDVFVRWANEAARLKRAGKPIDSIELSIDAKVQRLNEPEVSSVRFVSRVAA